MPLFSERKRASNIWHDTIHWWVDPTIKIRFVETGNNYWFVMGAESKKPDSNRSFFKLLSTSENYKRFKKGHGGEAYLRFGIYTKQFKNDVKDDAVCDCGHLMEDHDDSKENEGCLYDECNCKKFESFQITLLKKKKNITDIKFLKETEIKDDPLSWNCLYVNKYKKEDK